ncbi:hypothetical protein SEUBUCD646_0L04040 [Saccharomyces eubayanus]|uniref:Nonsense-mediated decay protein 4 n=2 Tax=Saccharomyces TaxID=4930 RepID=A0A6C1EC27_SACPS|nr:NMD4-like protein [Saccharomyces eubayanus]KOG98035.1 NMD4-like protein [Saccharomyces eubayanus]QID86916.1 nonsense-mediated decay protein 4 [Saccharomyces pastorianus]CAI1601136.1 hypothetical protein SEUBUCD650_0L04030 [Saccharomyces eubayanus]CAI1627586.1 hypothetical protein SEUBUCD646_0L04040 [Saccharomyces eubayanus]
MTQYNFIIDASAFEKGLGNIKRWCSDCTETVTLNFYIPTFTLNELDFLQQRRKSFAARESLKFIDRLDDPSFTNLKVFIEFPEVLDIILWSDVMEHNNNAGKVNIAKLPKRLKNLLKSCIYKCYLDGNEGLHWFLISEDSQIRDMAVQCNIPSCSIVDVDSILSKDMNDKSFRESEKFNNMMLKNGTKEESENGRETIKTNFDKTVYASRGTGELWSP